MQGRDQRKKRRLTHPTSHPILTPSIQMIPSLQTAMMEKKKTLKWSTQKVFLRMWKIDMPKKMRAILQMMALQIMVIN